MISLYLIFIIEFCDDEILNQYISKHEYRINMYGLDNYTNIWVIEIVIYTKQFF